jgi:phosphopantetheinyl transferase
VNLWVRILRAEPALGDALGREGVEARRALSRRALALAAEAMGARLGPERHGEHGQPLPDGDWHSSRSHARSCAAAACAPFALGVDVEEVLPRRDELVPRMCSRDELDLLGGFTWERAFRIWTAKEAVLKKAGVGLLELSACRLTAVDGDRQAWIHHRGRDHKVEQLSRDGHWVAIAHDGPEETEVKWRWSAA